MRSLPAIFLLLSIVALCGAADKPVEVAPQNISIGSEYILPDGRSVAMAMEIATPVVNPPLPHFPYGGDSQTYQPSLIIKSLFISVAGRPVMIPPQAFSDLGDPRGSAPGLLLVGKDVMLRIQGGGDGWSGYYADFVIHGQKLKERRVTNVMEESVLSKKAEVKTFR